MLKISRVQDGHKNLILLVQGTIPAEGKESLIDMDSVVGASKLRLQLITYAVEKPVSLWWEGGGPILPLDGRGYLDFGWFQGFKCPDEKLSGNYEIHGMAGSLVMLALEFIKQS